MASERKKRCRVKYKGFNEASHHLPVTHTHSQALTHTRSLTASLFTAPSLGLFSHSPLLWRCNKTDKRQMASEESLLQAAFSRHLVIQPVSWLVNKSTIQPNSQQLTKPVSWVGSFFVVNSHDEATVQIANLALSGENRWRWRKIWRKT